LGLVYDPKVKNFLKLSGLPGVELDNLEVEQLMEQSCALIDGQAQLKLELASRIMPLKTKALETARLALEMIG
jgi:hypothetical protein